jgi:hypothetical protein
MSESSTTRKRQTRSSNKNTSDTTVNNTDILSAYTGTEYDINDNNMSSKKIRTNTREPMETETIENTPKTKNHVIWK